MKFSEFASFLDTISNTSSRNSKTEVVIKLLRQLTKDEVAPAMYLIGGRVVPSFHPLEFGMSSKLVLRGVTELVDSANMQTSIKASGDIGNAFFENYSEVEDGKLDLREVYTTLYEIAITEGKGSQAIKLQMLKDLVSRSDRMSGKYILKVITGKLRLGLNDKTILDALSIILGGDKSKREILDKAYGTRADLGKIAELVLFPGHENLEELEIKPGFPVASKLVEREKDTEAIYQRLGDCFIQPKYDGLRAQVHFVKGGIEGLQWSTDSNAVQQNLFSSSQDKVRIFSRNMEDMTEMFPDVVQFVQELGVDSVVFDGEVIGYDFEKGLYISFQETIKRKRKYGVEGKLAEIPVLLHVFDVMYLNGRDISYESLDYRINKLRGILSAINHKNIILTETTEVKSGVEMEEKFLEYVNEGLEGIIAKSKSSYYKPGTRNYDWIKLKASSNKDYVDSVDAVVLGYYFGEGQRAKFGMGALLLGIPDENGNYASLAKLGTGMKDSDWVSIAEKLKNIELSSMPENFQVNKQLFADVWVEPKMVVEIEFDTITKSTLHKVKYGEDTLSVRFPRMIKLREDKDASQATSISEFIKLYELQKN